MPRAFSDGEMMLGLDLGTTNCKAVLLDAVCLSGQKPLTATHYSSHIRAGPNSTSGLSGRPRSVEPGPVHIPDPIRHELCQQPHREYWALRGELSAMTEALESIRERSYL